MESFVGVGRVEVWSVVEEECGKGRVEVRGGDWCGRRWWCEEGVGGRSMWPGECGEEVEDHEAVLRGRRWRVERVAGLQVWWFRTC